MCVQHLWRRGSEAHCCSRSELKELQRGIQSSAYSIVTYYTECHSERDEVEVLVSTNTNNVTALLLTRPFPKPINNQFHITK